MTYRGTVRGNVILQESGAQLPDGITVHVETESSGANGLPESPIDLFQMGELAVETGIPDLATNADRYLYVKTRIGQSRAKTHP